MGDSALDNPFWSSLRSIHRGLTISSSNDAARYPPQFAPFLGVEQRSHGMIIRNKVESLAFVLQFHSRQHHPEIIAEMQRARRLDAR